jgi:hypothetical protein
VLNEIPENEYNAIVSTVLNAKLAEIKRKEIDLYKIKSKLFYFAASRGFETVHVNNIFSNE